MNTSKQEKNMMKNENRKR